MDDLVSKLGGELHVTSTVFSTSAPHPRLGSYKQKGDGFGDQQKRREKAILMQKQRRKDYVDFARKIAEGELLSDSEGEGDEGSMDTWGEDEVDGQMDTSKGKPKQSKKKINPYRNQIMLSEWLVDIPEDFADLWLFVVCPVGRRCMVVASRGWTAAYTRTGYCIRRFPSYLPGGNQASGTVSKFSILDCIFDEANEVFYILDFMAWNSHVFLDSDRECRYFFLESKLTEDSSRLGQRTSRNPLLFQFLPQYPCKKEILEELFSKTYSVPVDGLLFFHKQGHYKRNYSPLCTWLKPHMVPEVLGLKVSQLFLDSAPEIVSKKNKKSSKMES